MQCRVTIYALIDPRDPERIRYVGQTTQPSRRLRKHLKVAGRDRPTYRGNWIRSLLDEGVQPVMRVLLRVQARHKDAAERHMIRTLRAAGHPLVNGSLGGDGGALNPEIQQRVNAKLRAGIAAGTIKLPTMTPEQRARCRQTLSALRSTVEGNPMNRPEVQAKNAASQRARAAARGYVAPIRLKKGTPEHSQMMSRVISARGADYRANLSAALAGKPKSAEHRAALREASLRAWAKRKAETPA